jgi:hypothetical protein
VILLSGGGFYVDSTFQNGSGHAGPRPFSEGLVYEFF